MGTPVANLHLSTSDEFRLIFRINQIIQRSTNRCHHSVFNIACRKELIRTSDCFLLNRITLVLSHIFEEGPAQIWVIHRVLGQPGANYFRLTNISLAVFCNPEVDAAPPRLETAAAQKASCGPVGKVYEMCEAFLEGEFDVAMVSIWQYALTKSQSQGLERTHAVKLRDHASEATAAKSSGRSSGAFRPRPPFQPRRNSGAWRGWTRARVRRTPADRHGDRRGGRKCPCRSCS